MYINSKMQKINYLLFLFFFIVICNSKAEIINEIKINGNDLITDQTVINFSEASIGDDVSNIELNKFLKNLYETKYFEDVNLTFEKNILTINVKEFPIIQEIIINGIKADKTKKELKDQIVLKEKNPFNETLVKNSLDTISNIFKNSGYYLIDVNVSVKKNTNKTVTLIFDVDRGEQATIKEIKFIGDKKYKDRKLFSVITSEENKFWKFITNNKYINIERINLDKRLLRNFYLNKGYYDVVINDAYTKLINNKDFVLTFNISAGKKYKFGKLDLTLPIDYEEKHFVEIKQIFNKLENTQYSLYKIEDILDEIDKIALNQNYEFINAQVNETVSQDNINFDFLITETQKTYVNRINIYGNNITTEEFIRNNLLVDEGDPFNSLLHNKSLNKLRSKGFFSSVTSKIKSNNEDENLTDIDLYFEEKATGEISAGAGVGTDGTTFSLGIKENNFNGKGIGLTANLDLGEDSIKGILSYTHPNFAYSDRSVTTSLESIETDKLKKSGYKNNVNAIAFSTRYEQFDDLFFSPGLSISSESLETNSSASTALKKQEGSYFDFLFDYGLTYDQRNQPFQPTEGYISRWYQNIPLSTDQAAIVNGYSITGYKEIIDDMVISTGLFARAINSVSDDDVRISRRLYAPKSRLRGFESGKVGPKDGKDYVGGNYVATFNASSTVPYILQTMENMDFKVFFDAGNVWGVDYSDTVDESNKIRTSTGVALELLTPVGPLTFSFAEAITKASTDKTETFRFQLGTSF